MLRHILFSTSQRAIQSKTMEANPSDRTRRFMNLSKSRQILMQTFKEFIDDKTMRLSATLAHYSVFSLAPLLLINSRGQANNNGLIITG